MKTTQDGITTSPAPDISSYFTWLLYAMQEFFICLRSRNLLYLLTKKPAVLLLYKSAGSNDEKYTVKMPSLLFRLILQVRFSSLLLFSSSERRSFWTPLLQLWLMS